MFNTIIRRGAVIIVLINANTVTQIP